MLIRPFEDIDEDAVVALWSRCGLLRAWNDPHKDIARKRRVQSELFLVGKIDDELVASVMAGYDGHRGWINYLAVDPLFQRRGLGRELMAEVQPRLQSLGCSKINLQIRRENVAAVAFYERIGFSEDAALSFGKRLERDDGDAGGDAAWKKVGTQIPLAVDGMDIRAATPDDAHALWEAESATAAIPGQLASRPEEISVASLDARIRTVSQAGCFFVAEGDGRLLGHAVLEPMGLLAVQHVYRLTIVVHPGQTGHGIGTALLQHVQGWATSRPGLHKIELNVRATNAPAIRLYTRLVHRL